MVCFDLLVVIQVQQKQNLLKMLQTHGMKEVTREHSLNDKKGCLSIKKT